MNQIPRRPLRDDVYKQLLARIYRGELSPGERVRDTALASELGVSRTPVREALLRLSREGLVESDLGRGFSIRPFSAREAAELASISSALECLGLRETASFPDERLAQLDEINAELEANREDAEQSMLLNDEWHQLLLDGCENQRLLELLATLKEQMRRYTFAYMKDAGRVGHATQDHAAIVESLRAGDRAAAERRLAAHWMGGVAALREWLVRQFQTQPAGAALPREASY